LKLTKVLGQAGDLTSRTTIKALLWQHSHHHCGWHHHQHCSTSTEERRQLSQGRSSVGGP